jgi:hypothetical protein
VVAGGGGKKQQQEAAEYGGSRKQKCVRMITVGSSHHLLGIERAFFMMTASPSSSLTILGIMSEK